MKKTFSMLLATSMLFGLVSCNNAKTYTVTWDLNYEGATVWAPSTVKEGLTIERPADPSRDGYTFTDWYTEKACTNAYNFTLLAAADITLYAGWKANHTVVWNLNYENAPLWSPSHVQDGTPVAKPNDPSRDGFVFSGWFTETECTNEYNFSLLITADITLYAGWEEDIPSATFTMGPAKNNPNAGDVVSANTETSYEVTPNVESSVQRNARVGILAQTNCPAQYGTSANDYWLKTKKAADAYRITLTIFVHSFVASPYGGVVWMQVNYTLSEGETVKPFYTENYEEITYESGTKYKTSVADGVSVMRIYFDKCTKDVFINSVSFKVIVPNT